MTGRARPCPRWLPSGETASGGSGGAAFSTRPRPESESAGEGGGASDEQGRRGARPRARVSRAGPRRGRVGVVARGGNQGALEVEWAVPVAYADRAACVAVINAMVKTWEGAERGQPQSQNRQRVERSPSGTAADFKNLDGWTAYRLRCRPDTVDPRGPKGGVR